MPHVVIKTGMIGTDGKEEIVQEYLCDWPDCMKLAEHVLGVAIELRAAAILCSEHAAMRRKQHHRSD